MAGHSQVFEENVLGGAAVWQAFDQSVGNPDTLKAAIDNVRGEEEAIEILCAQDTFNELNDALDRLGVEADVAEIMRIPENDSVFDSEKAVSMQKLIDQPEDNVQNVNHNAAMPE